MYVVAISELGTAVADEAVALARDVGQTAYETRLLLARGTPAIVLRTPDEAIARELVRKLRARGHEATTCDESVTVSMLTVRSVRLETGLVADEIELSYEAMLAVVRGARPTKTKTTDEVTERKLRPGMALMTGGLVSTKKTTREVHRIVHDKEDVLYLFVRDEPPRILGEHHLTYTGLLNPARTQRENFLRIVSELKAKVPAVVDERLLGFRPQSDDSEIMARELDLCAYVLALGIARRAKRLG